MDTFREFFRKAAATAARPDGYEPHGYQERIALEGLPAVVRAPTGTGKTGIILAWLWRRLNEVHRDNTPRRLVYALPQRSLVEQVAGEAGRWLANLELTGQVALHVVMGGAGESQRQWRLDMHKPAIVVGTVDSLVSKALNRGYGIGRASYPAHLDQHSEDVRDQATALLSVIGAALPSGAGRSAVAAAYLHDVGKAHKTWQDALCSLAPEERKAEVDAGRPWAKSGTSLPLRFDGGVAFRHELASLLMLDGPLGNLLADAPDADLARYLVLAHHGKLRVQVRDPGDLAVLAAGEASENRLLGLEEGATVDVPPLLGQPAAQFTVDLEQFRLGGERSWTRTALGLRDRYGPFVLAYLETLVRIADWRASAGLEVAR